MRTPPLPFALGCLAVALAAALVLVGKRFEASAKALRGEPVRPVAAGVPADAVAFEPPHAMLNPDETYWGDLSRLFQVASSMGVRMGRVEYRAERGAASGTVTRVVEFQLAEDYPKVKLLLAEFFRTVPHCYLQEIRFDRKDPKAGQTQVHLKLALVYEDSDGHSKR